MNDLIVFENGDFGEVRTVFVDSKPYFVANDIAKILGYQEPKLAVKQHCKKVNKIKGCDSPFGNVDINTIPESDMFRLIMRSNLPKAVEFQDWVVEDVLPSIRKRGGYVMVHENESEIELNKRVQSMVDAAVKSKSEKIEFLEKALFLATPAVDFRSFATKNGKEWTISDAADEFGMTLGEIRASLRMVAFFRRRVMPGGASRWWPKEKFFDCFYCKHVDGGLNYAFTIKGMEWLAVLVEDGSKAAGAKYEMERQLSLFE